MAAREFHVTFHNDTPFSLRRGIFNNDHGHWTTEPPAVIPPNTRNVEFGLDSDGWFRGVEGEVYYQIDDAGKFVNGHMATGGGFRIHVENPFFGGPTSMTTDARFESSPDALDPGDASSDFQLRTSGIRPSADTTGPLDTDGWTELVPGTPLVLPIPWGHLGHVWTEWQLRVKPPAPPPEFHLDAPPPPTKSRPVSSGPFAAFSGDWAEVPASGAPRLRVTVDRSGELFDVRVKDESLALDVRGLRGTVEPATPIYVRDVWTRPDDGILHLSPALRPPTVAVREVFRVTTYPSAYTLRLDPRVRIMLYGDFTAEGALLLKRLRYLRTDDDGGTVRDVLLMPFSLLR